MKEKVARFLQGRVVGCKMTKTITVLVERRVKHPLYGKYIFRSKKYHVRDAEGAAEEGDFVRIEACRPYSKTVSFQLSGIIRKVPGSYRVLSS